MSKRHGAAPLATEVHICKKGGLVHIQKEISHKYDYGKAGRVYNISIAIVVNRHVKSNILTKRINGPVGSIKHSNSQNSFLKLVAESDKKKEAGEVPGHNPVNLLHLEKPTRSEPMRRSLSPWKAFPMNSWDQGPARTGKQRAQGSRGTLGTCTKVSSGQGIDLCPRRAEGWETQTA